MRRATPRVHRPTPAAQVHRASIVVNSKSRQGHADLRPAVEYLRAHRVEVSCHHLDAPDDMATCIRRQAASTDVIVIAGGDGTIHRALPVLLTVDLPVAILPLGTGNDLARSLGVPLELEQAIRTVSSGRIRRVDVGRVNGHPFINGASLGVSVRVARALDGSRKRRLGVLSYPIALAREMWRADPFSAYLDCDGRLSRLRALQLWVANGSSFGGGTVVHPDADIDDGQLDVFSIGSPWDHVRSVASLVKSSTQPATPGHIQRARRVSIRTTTPQDVNADGEIVATTPARFDVLEQAMAIMVPRSESSP